MSKVEHMSPQPAPRLNVELHLRLLRENALKPSTLASALKKLSSIREQLKPMGSDNREVP